MRMFAWLVKTRIIHRRIFRQTLYVRLHWLRRVSGSTPWDNLGWFYIQSVQDCRISRTFCLHTIGLRWLNRLYASAL